MIRKLLPLVLVFAAPFSGAVACPSGYAFIDTVTVAAQGSLSGNLTNKAELFVGSNVGFQTTGGHVLHSTWPLDIVPCTGAGTGTVIPFEIVPSSYSATSGTFEMWLNLPAINKSSTATFYIMVGNSSPSDLTCNQNNTAVCTSVFTNCVSIQHTGFDNGTTTGQVLYDSCANVTGTNHSSTKVDNVASPPVFEAAGFNLQWYDTGVTPGTGITSSWTVEHWISNKDSASAHNFIGNLDGSTLGFDEVTLTGGSCNIAGAGTVCVQINLATNASNLQQTSANFNFGNSNAWHHFASTHTAGTCGTTTCNTIFADGVSQTVFSVGRAGTPVDAGNSTSSFHIGKAGTAAASPNWTGTNQLDEIQLYSSAFSADQILADFTFQNNPTAQYTNSFAAAGTTRHRAWVIQSGN